MSINADLLAAPRTDEGHEHRRMLLLAVNQPRFFAWDFSVLAARWTRHGLNAIDGARLDAWFVSQLNTERSEIAIQRFRGKRAAAVRPKQYEFRSAAVV